MSVLLEKSVRYWGRMAMASCIDRTMDPHEFRAEQELFVSLPFKTLFRNYYSSLVRRP